MVSIIIPVLNEEKNIQKIQDNLSQLEGDYEVIFSDGGSTDRTVELIRSPFRVITGNKGRGVQMNRGAREAKGDILFFIHCDVALEKDVLQKLPLAVKEGNAVGYLRIVFVSKHWLMKVCGFMSDMRSRFRKIVFADQSFIIHRDLLEKCGRIPELRFMEDYELSIRLKEQKIPVVKVPSRIYASSRRFEKNGMLRTMWQMQVMQARYRKSRNVGTMEEEYGMIR